MSASDAFSSTAARLTAGKPPLAYAPTSEHKATRHLLTLEHNATRTLFLLLLDCGLLDAERAPPTASAEIQLDLSLLARMESAEQVSAQRRLLAARAPTPFFSDVLRDLCEFKERAFDQYAGLRQIGDLRGLPRCGATLFAAATPVVRQLSQLADAVVVVLMSHAFLWSTSTDGETQQRGIALMRDALSNGERCFAALSAEYEPCLAAIVASVGCLRSKHVTDRSSGSGGEQSLNDVYQRRFIQAVIDATGAHERHMREVLATVLGEVDQCVEATRTRIYAELGGRPAVLERAELALDGLRPWAVDWLKVQKDAFQMREVFAADIDSLHRVLDQSLQQMLLGFRECLTQGVVSVMIPLDEDLTRMRQLVASHRKLSMGSG
jgi:hypothetical protein